MNAALWVIVVIVVIVAILAFGLAWWRKRAPLSRATGGREGACPFGTADVDVPSNGFEGGARIFRLGVREPWFEQMTLGKKVVVGRLQRGAFGPDARHPLKAGDPVTVARSRPRDDTTEYPGIRRYETTVVHIEEYPTFRKMLKAEGMGKVFPGVKTEAAALKEYAQFYSEADQQGAAVVAIKVKPPAAAALKPKQS
jgi:ASC-1-like (ASCH) protein